MRVPSDRLWEKWGAHMGIFHKMTYRKYLNLNMALIWIMFTKYAAGILVKDNPTNNTVYIPSHNYRHANTSFSITAPIIIMPEVGFKLGPEVVGHVVVFNVPPAAIGRLYSIAEQCLAHKCAGIVTAAATGPYRGWFPVFYTTNSRAFAHVPIVESSRVIASKTATITMQSDDDESALEFWLSWDVQLTNSMGILLSSAVIVAGIVQTLRFLITDQFELRTLHLGTAVVIFSEIMANVNRLIYFLNMGPLCTKPFIYGIIRFSSMSGFGWSFLSTTTLAMLIYCVVKDTDERAERLAKSIVYGSLGTIFVIMQTLHLIESILETEAVFRVLPLCLQLLGHAFASGMFAFYGYRLTNRLSSSVLLLIPVWDDRRHLLAKRVRSSGYSGLCGVFGQIGLLTVLEYPRLWAILFAIVSSCMAFEGWNHIIALQPRDSAVDDIFFRGFCKGRGGIQ